MNNKKHNPHAEYASRLAARRAAFENEQRRSRKIWIWRRALFALIIVMIVAAIEGAISPWLIALPVIAFIALMAVHQKIHQARDRFERATKFYERGLARLEDKWAGAGEQGKRFADKHHLYSEDLDLFGEGSLFEMLNIARTGKGEERLAAWLLSPAPIPEILARQESIEELRSRLDLREDIALISASVESGVHAEELSAWGTAPALLKSALMPALAAIIGVFTLVAVVLWFGFGYRLLALAALLAEMIFLFIYRSQVAKVIMEVDRPGRDLELLSEILARLEKEQFTSSRLVELRRALDTDGIAPSTQIAKLARLIQILDSTRNQFFAVFAFILLIPAQLAYRIDQWRQRSGPKISKWIDAVGEMEALSSLASYAYERPDDPFPELVGDQTRFDGEALGHPLIPESRCIRNDLRLGDDLRLLVISGSNMSGKSTLMRTVGVNVVLALAGAPVRAKRLTLSPLSIGASIHILDSLQTGASRFYAEITRLRQIVELTGAGLPLLFLLDEILSGTNSHDRRIGAEAVVKGLVERGAIGMVTTHDLALTQIVENLGSRAANVHFEDHLENGEMRFDYKMREGIVRRSNALELMRAVGLDV